jgi:hypothetical protein
MKYSVVRKRILEMRGSSGITKTNSKVFNSKSLSPWMYSTMKFSIEI